VDAKGLMAQLQTENIQKILEVFIRYQYAANANLTLGQIHQLDTRTYRLHPGIVTFLTQERDSIREVLRDELNNRPPPGQQSLVSLFVTTTKEYIYQQNQFVSLSAKDQTELIRLYRQFLADTVNILSKDRNSDEIERLYQVVLEDHFHCLKTFITNLGEAQSTNLIYHQVICQEYPASLQLEILGIDPKTLQEPILDIGCGKHGTLATYLREFGLEAWGIDRLVMPLDYLIETDWLEFEFAPSTWGTIISHMAFSNHFTFHHLYRNGTPKTYVAKYMEILASLKPGGKTFYAPGLPFIEQLLPAKNFAVTLKNVCVPEQGRPGRQSLYATKIRKLST